MTGYIFDSLAARAPKFVPWAGPNAPLVYAAEASYYFAGGSFLLAALFACTLRFLSKKEVISATYATTGSGVVTNAGGIYIDDDFEFGEGGAVGEEGSTVLTGPVASIQQPYTEPETGNTSESAVNVISPPPATNLQPPFDSGIASYVGDGAAAPVIEVIDPIPHSIPDPSTFLSPAPLPSSLFLTSAETEMQTPVDLGCAEVDSTAVMEAGEGAIGVPACVDLLVSQEEDRGACEVITTAGVPMGNLPTRSTIQPLAVQTATSTDTWNAPASASIVVPPPATEVDRPVYLPLFVSLFSHRYIYLKVVG